VSNYCIVYWLILLIPSLPVKADTQIVYWHRLQDNPAAFQILQLALDKTAKKFGTYALIPSESMEQERAELELQNGRLDIANFAPDTAREALLEPVRIPVTQGLLGYRVCLIKTGSQHLFDPVQTLSGWRENNLTIGQETGWPDTEILEANQLKVVKVPKYPLLFTMLDQGRFDCFSRSISEVAEELNAHPELELEKNLLLVYRLPTFFFVNKTDKTLAKRLHQGLQSAYKDGSISALIKGYYRNQFETMGIAQRTVLYLENPLLTRPTREALEHFQYWLDIKEFQP